MSETEEPDLSVSQSNVHSPSAGELIRVAREKAGLHVAAVAVALKVPVRKIEALEGNRYEDLGDAVFIRALAGSVCRQIRTDPAPVLALLPNAQPIKLSKAEGPALAALPTGLGSRSATSMWAALPKSVIAIVLLLLVAAVALALLPRLSFFDTPSVAAIESKDVQLKPTVTTPRQQPSLGPQAGGSMGRPAVQIAGAGLASVPSGESPTLMASAVVSTATAVLAKDPAVTTTSAAERVTPIGSVPGAWITFTAKGESWVEAVSANGTVLIRRTMTAGESASIAGTPPVKVTIGQAPNTTVTVRGQLFDTSPYMRQDVARFTLD